MSIETFSPQPSKKAKLKSLHQPTFPTEELLQQAIAGLLVRMSGEFGISEVQILQGPQELGKDLIFYIPGGFGEPLLCACVVKNIKINGDVAKGSGARTIVFHAEQA